MVSRPFFRPIFNQLDNVRFQEIDLKITHKGFGGIMRLFKELKKQKFDAVADLHGVLRTHLLRTLFQLSGVKVAKINKGRDEKKALTRSSNKVFSQLKTTHERYADVFRELGFEIDLKAVTNPTAKKDKVSQKQRIGIAPFAQHAAKQYPLKLMKEVAFQLSQDHEVLLFGGGNAEKSELDSWANASPTIISSVGKQAFVDELKLISTLDLMISMDSGNGHLAANFKVPVLTIWGLTHPFAGFAPFSSSEKNWLLPNRESFPLIPTSVYGNNLPEGYEKAIETISPDMIIAQSISLLK